MIIITGLGPGEYDRIPSHVRELLEDGAVTVIIRTLQHPAAMTLAGLRPVESCDDLYESHDRFEDVYEAITARVIDRATSHGEVVYAVPGTPLIGELSVRQIVGSGADVEVIPGESFVDHILAVVGYDPLERGLQILDGHRLPEPLVLDKPTIIAQLDTPEALADIAALVGGVVAEGSLVQVIRGDELIEAEPGEIDPGLAGLRTSLFIDAEPGGLLGVIKTVRRLREECPWDREQTHQSLVKNLIEETYELVEVIGQLPLDDEPDWSASSAVEDELGDVLLQVLMHEAIGRERGEFDIDIVAEGLRQKLVRRHPHVFAGGAASTAEEVKSNWDVIKESEMPDRADSLLSGIPVGLPALHRAGKMQNRAAKAGFDWERADQVVPKVIEELDEVTRAIDDGPAAVTGEVGDLLFSVVNLARHLGVDPELALRSSIDKFECRFRAMEAAGPLEGLSLEQLDERWNRAKGC